MCAVLDSAILWLRHNLRKKLEVNCYLQVLILPSALYFRRTVSLIVSLSRSRACIRTCHQVISFLQKHGIRLGTLYTRCATPTRTHIRTQEYHWIEFWRAVLGTLEFLTKKIDELQSVAGVRPLIKEVSTPLTTPFPIWSFVDVIPIGSVHHDSPGLFTQRQSSARACGKSGD